MDTLSRSARTAITAAADRLDRAAAADDVEAIIGSAKEYIETAAKAVLDAVGAGYGSDISMDRLAVEALRALERHPSALQERPALQRLSSSLIGVAKAIAELRNTDGTGHGRATPSNLDLSHAALVRATSVAWVTWLLSTADRTLPTHPGIDIAVTDIGGAAVFSRGALVAYLEGLSLGELQEADQRKLGLAVARRWTVNKTFMPLIDVVEPIAGGEADYPPAFCEGLAEGLILDQNGYIRTTADDVQQAVDVASRLPARRRRTLFEQLADGIDEARPFSGLNAGGAMDIANAVGTLQEDRRNASIRLSLHRIADRMSRIADELKV